MERIRARRADSDERVAPIAARSDRASARRFMLPLGLAAAAALAIIVPRAMREPVADGTPSVSGAKGATPSDIVVRQAVVTETGPTSIDSISWDFSDATGVLSAELRYLSGIPESARAELLASRIAGQLREAGLGASSIAVIPVPTGAASESPPAGAVGVTVRARPAP